MDNVVKAKSFAFAIRIVKLEKYLRNSKKEYVLSRQVLKAGTSIGANVAEAEYAISRREFVAKMYIALKECAETIYWIELLNAGDYITSKEYVSLLKDCVELRKILSSITKTSRET